MKAARWDFTLEQGGLWRVVLRRRVGTEPGTFAAPTKLDLLHEDGTLLVSVAATVSVDGLTATLARTAAQTTALTAGRYEHRLTMTDPTLADTVMLARGYAHVNATVGRS